MEWSPLDPRSELILESLLKAITILPHLCKSDEGSAGWRKQGFDAAIASIRRFACHEIESTPLMTLKSSGSMRS